MATVSKLSVPKPVNLPSMKKVRPRTHSHRIDPRRRSRAPSDTSRSDPTRPASPHARPRPLVIPAHPQEHAGDDSKTPATNTGDGHPPTATPPRPSATPPARSQPPAPAGRRRRSRAQTFAAPAPTHTPPPLLPFSPTRTNPPRAHLRRRRIVRAERRLDRRDYPVLGDAAGGRRPGRRHEPGARRWDDDERRGGGALPAMNEDAIGNGNEPANGIGTIATEVGTDAGRVGRSRLRRIPRLESRRPGDGQSRRVGRPGPARVSRRRSVRRGPARVSRRRSVRWGSARVSRRRSVRRSPTRRRSTRPRIDRDRNWNADRRRIEEEMEIHLPPPRPRAPPGSARERPRRLPRPTRSATRSKPNSNGSSRNKRRNDADANALRIQPR